MSARDPVRRLLRALERSAAAAGCTVKLHHEALTPWASATFVGGQHRVAAITGPDAAAWLRGLATADLPLPNFYVASVAVEARESGAVLTILVLEE